MALSSLEGFLNALYFLAILRRRRGQEGENIVQPQLTFAVLRLPQNCGRAAPHDTTLYRQRHKIEIMFGRLKDWRRVVARIEATPLGLDILYVVTSLQTQSPEDIYARLYCAGGQAEHLIKLHKSQLKSDRTSCRSPLPNQMRLILHTAAYWLMLTVRDAIPRTHALARAEFATLRIRLLKIGAHIRETAHRVRIAFAAACPDAILVRHLASALRPAPP